MRTGHRCRPVGSADRCQHDRSGVGRISAQLDQRFAPLGVGGFALIGQGTRSRLVFVRHFSYHPRWPFT